MGGFAWVTLATNDSYSLGALVLAHSLKKVNTKYDLAVLITPGVTEVMREKLSSVFTLVKEVNVLDSKDETNLALLSRPELGITFTKLHCWRLTQYDKCVFIDADALVIKNSDELFERDELSAAPDVGWPDCFNSGVFVFKPSQLTFASLISHAKSHGSFDGGDQGLLNSFFSDWSHKDISKHLPFIYNMCSIATYSYLPAFKQFGEDVKIIHFIGSTKPWLQHFDTLTGQVQPHSDTGYLQPMLQHWWNIFCENVHPQLSPVMASSTLATTHWHDLQYPVSSKPTLTRHVCHDKTTTTTTTDKKTHDEIDAVPDFTNFRDPWEYYIVSTPENPVAHSSQQIPQTQTIQQQQQQQQQHQQVNQDVVNQISQSMSNITIQHDQNNNNNNNTNNNDNNVQNQISHDYPSYQYNQLNNIKIDNSINNNLSYQYEQSKPSTSRQIDYDHVEYTRHNLPDNNNNDGIDETDIISKKYNNIDNSKIIIDDNININLNDNLLVNDNNNPQSQFKICTKSNCIESKSDMNIINNIENNAGIAGALAKITLGETRTSEQVALEEHMRKYGWEQGQIDYMGRDSFDNIWKKINTTLESTSSKSDKATVKTKSSETEDKITTKKVDKLNDKTSENIPDDTTKIESGTKESN